MKAGEARQKDSEKGSADETSQIERLKEALRKSEELNRALLSSLSNQIAVMDRTGRIIAVNDAWMNHGCENCMVTGARIGVGDDYFSACRQSTEAGSDKPQKALEGIHSVMEGARNFFEMEYSCPAPSGHKRFRMSATALRYGAGGAIVSHHDVTEQKLAEERLQEVSGRLINAQEKERRRIARELHDDLNQRLALLSIDLEQLGRRLPKKAVDLRNQVQDLWARAKEISTDVHRISYHLHPSKLDTLGLVAAVRSLCREISERHEPQILFSHRDVPPVIDKDIALCLFRVAQESLHNVVKHSGAREARVEISGHQNTIRLIVYDNGAGFNPETLGERAGLGLVGMEERLRLVGGEFSIQSEPLRGTRIEAQVPLTITGA